MIALPPDFDASGFITDLLTVAAPFVSIAGLIVCAVLIKRALKS